ncbi:MAG: ABC transporter C-terminal domain-containing protein [Gammaproteobacteria bacterium]|nr:ABC transporter C-terminal domain-containing protein [Gammaproteobacteria bacterium]
MERHIADLEARIAAIHEQFAAPEVYSDGRRVQALQQDEARLRTELAAAYEQWGNVGRSRRLRSRTAVEGSSPPAR